MKKSLLAAALAALTLAAAPAAQAVTAASFLNTPSPGPSDMTSPGPSEMSGSPSAGEAGKPFGPGCSQLPAEGPGSPADLAGKPLDQALKDVPQLSTLAKAVEAAGLTDQLKSAQDITVFAPVNDAFAKIPKEALAKVLEDKEQLSKIIQNHIVEGRKSQADLAAGTLTTVGGGTLNVTGSGEDYTVNDAKILCGNIQTSNATVYLVDSVLMPEAGASASASASASPS
ncbi:fasciclin domain-containing protein [Streptosporangium sp. NPDC048047]|uniref:fasciclin domain-containing protein n=1 Tax=Streptosporangium sp. NPDC048047 TaxID=3155748 RepID=UPI00342AFA9F